jgi:hypothetical protein
MKREIPVFQYDDAWQILARGDRLNGLVIDAGSEEVMLRIEASMSKLKVMGDDDRRFFWIWAQVNKREREWLQVLTAHYNDFHYLILGDNRSEMAVLQNAESIYSNEEKYREDVKEPLLALETHVKAVVDWVCEAPEEYHAYVERYLPYDKRNGDIPRKVFYSIDPEWHDGKDDEKLIRGLEEVKAAAPLEFDSITLRTYITVWSAAYRILSQIRYDERDKGYERKLLHDAQTMDDIELFMEYDSKGQEIEGLNLDSQEDYEKWRKANCGFHCMDVSYARIHLSPWRENESESYRFHLNFGVYGFYDEVAEIAIALHKQGITLKVDEIDSILKILRQEDMVGFRPHPDKYMNRDGVTNQVWLPHIGDVTREVYWKIIKSTKWHKQHKPWPND